MPVSEVVGSGSEAKSSGVSWGSKYANITYIGPECLSTYVGLFGSSGGDGYTVNLVKRQWSPQTYNKNTMLNSALGLIYNKNQK